MPPRVVVCHGPGSGQAAERLAGALHEADIECARFGEPTLARESIDGCEALVALFDARGSDCSWLDQALGIALARGIPVFAASRAPRGMLPAAAIVERPRSQRAFRELVARIRAALPATPRASVRSLAQSSEKRWTRVVTEEVEAELTARGWTRVPLAEAREERARVFVEALPGDAWWKEVDGRRVWLRPRVAPFNPVDLLHVRERAAARVHEWWILRDGRSDAWMKRVYRGESEKLTARTKFFGQRVSVAGAGPQLVDKRILTERVDRTGTLARELAALEEWLALQHVPRIGEQHVGAPEIGVPLRPRELAHALGEP
jgi:hypothetical protein